MRSRIRNNIAEFLNAAFSPPLQLHHLTLDPWTLGPGTKESSPLCTTQEGGNPLPTHLGEAWSSHCGKKLNIRQISKSMSNWDFQRSKNTPYFPSKFSQFPNEEESRCSLMEKGMLPCCCVSESGVCIDKGHTDGSIRQFLKPTAISSWAWLALAYIVP